MHIQQTCASFKYWLCLASLCYLPQPSVAYRALRPQSMQRKSCIAISSSVVALFAAIAIQARNALRKPQIMTTSRVVMLSAAIKIQAQSTVDSCFVHYFRVRK